MATHPDDPNTPQHDDQTTGAAQPAEGEAGKPNPKHTKIARQASKPTMMARDEHAAEQPALPNMSLEETEAAEAVPVLEPATDDDIDEVVILEAAEEVPVLTPAVTPAVTPADDVIEMEAVEEDVLSVPVVPVASKDKSHITAELAHTPPPTLKDDAAQPPSAPVFDIAEAEPIFDDLEALPTSGKHAPADVTGAEHVLGEDVAEALPASGSGALVGSDVLGIAEPVSGLEDVLGDEPHEPGSRPSARVESPLRTEGQPAVDLGAPGKKRKQADLDATEEVLAGEPTGKGSSAVDWNDVGGLSDVAKAAQEDETIAFDASSFDDGSAVNLGGPSSASKGKNSSGIDAVAEALESGVNIEDAGKISPPLPSVEFDDILADEAELPSGNLTSQTDDELKAVSKGKGKKKSTGDTDVDEAAAAAVFGEDEEAVAAPVEDEIVSVPADDDEAVAAPVADEEEEAPRKKKKKGKGKAIDEDDAELEPAGKRGAKGPPVVASGPGCLGRLVTFGAGAVLSVLLVLGGVFGLAFVSPETLDSALQTLPNANLKKPIIQPQTAAPVLTPAERGAQKLAAGQYDDALQEVGDDNEPAAKAVRGEARFLKRAQDAKQPLTKDDPEVQKALKELSDSPNKALAQQIDKSFDAQGKVASANLLLKEIATAAQKAGINGEAKDLPKALVAMAAAKQQADLQLKSVGSALAAAKVIDNPADLAADQIEKKLKELTEAQTAFGSVNKVLKDADVKDDGAKGVAELVTAKKEAEQQLTEVNKVLAEAKLKDGAKGVQELVDTRAKLQKDRDELAATTKSAFDELVKAKVVAPGADPRQGLVEGAKAARAKAESPLAIPLTYLGASLGSLGTSAGRVVANSVDMGVLVTELGMLKAREPFIQLPVQKLDTFALLLQDRSFTDPKQLAAIVRETDWVLSPEAKVAPADRAKALYVNGLALRNEGKFDAARKALTAAAKEPGAKDAPWHKQAATALAELTDPRVYFLPQIDRLQLAGNIPGALAETDRALRVLPGDGRLLAERALLRLELNRGSGKLSAEVQQQIRKDADGALKTGATAAVGEYVLGRLDEQQGQYAGAEAHYRAALKAHPTDDDEASRYRGALARVLLLDRPAAAAPPVEAAPPADKKDAGTRLPSVPTDRPTGFVHPVTRLLLPVLVGQTADEPEVEVENKDTALRVRESIELAKKLAASKDAKTREEGYRLLIQAATKAGAKLTSTTCLELGKELTGQVDPKVRGVGMLLTGHGLVKQGRRTDGLKEYVRGQKLLHDDVESGDVLRMVEDHPAFQHPDAANKPNPLLAEKHFGNGLHLFYAKQYPAAEEQFKQALDYFGQDARYAYFLGLSQLNQPSRLKRDQAYFSFERGAQLEAQGRPGIAEINTSLERIQGEVRQRLNRYRFKGTTAATP